MPPCECPDLVRETNNEHIKELNARIDRLTQDLCYVCGTLVARDELHLLSDRIRVWWQAHQKADTKRVYKQMKKECEKFEFSLDMADSFIGRAEQVHPVSQFHKNWFADLAERVFVEMIEDEINEGKEKKEREQILQKLSPHERKVLGI